MANTITGRVMRIMQPVSAVTKSGAQFTKREIVLDCSKYDPYTGEKRFDNPVCVTFTQDNVSLLDNIMEGHIATVSIDIQGRYYQPKDSYFVDIRGYAIEVVRQSATTPVAQAAPSAPAVAPMQQHQQASYPGVQPQYVPQQAPQVPPANPYGSMPFPGGNDPFNNPAADPFR